MSTAAVLDTKKQDAIAAFGIKADHHRNSDLLLQGIPGCRLRSTIKASRAARNPETGEEWVPQDQARHLGILPEIPGMELHVNPKSLTYKVYDPLTDNKELCERIVKRLSAASFNAPQEIRGVPTKEASLDKDRMKTLLREMIWLVDAGDAHVCRGVMPTLEQVEQSPGRFLLNPGSTLSNTQPRFECDWDSWLEKLTLAGG